jgi:hypothetical protein
MICVLRIGGIELNPDLVRQTLSLAPYRTDVRGKDAATVTCLHYDVVDDISCRPDQFAAKVHQFLSTHGAELESVALLEGIEFRILDFGLMLQEDRASVSLELDEALIHALSRLDLAVSISTYPVSESA